MGPRKSIKPEGFFTSPFFSPAIQTGQFLFISGGAALDERGNILGPGNCEEQSEYIMQGIQKILEAAGASLNDVVKTTTFLTNAADYPAYNRVRSKYFDQDPPYRHYGDSSRTASSRASH